MGLLRSGQGNRTCAAEAPRAHWGSSRARIDVQVAFGLSETVEDQITNEVRVYEAVLHTNYTPSPSRHRVTSRALSLSRLSRRGPIRDTSAGQADLLCDLQNRALRQAWDRGCRVSHLCPNSPASCTNGVRRWDAGTCLSRVGVGEGSAFGHVRVQKTE